MKEHIIYGKFELASYSDEKKQFEGGSHVLSVTFDKMIKDEKTKKDIEDIIDLLDHATMISKQSPFFDFIDKESVRRIEIDGKIDIYTPALVIKKEIEEYLKDLNLDQKIIRIDCKVDFINESISIDGNQKTPDYNIGNYNFIT